MAGRAETLECAFSKKIKVKLNSCRREIIHISRLKQMNIRDYNGKRKLCETPQKISLYCQKILRYNFLTSRKKATNPVAQCRSYLSVLTIKKHFSNIK